MKDFGEHVQYSVFECLLEDAALDRLRKRLEEKVVAEEDSVRIYRLCADCRGKVAIFGLGVLRQRLIAQQVLEVGNALIGTEGLRLCHLAARPVT